MILSIAYIYLGLNKKGKKTLPPIKKKTASTGPIRQRSNNHDRKSGVRDEITKRAGRPDPLLSVYKHDQGHVTLVSNRCVGINENILFKESQ